jgi:hypothetical protein
MPKLTASKEEVKGLPAMSEGLVTVRLDGFKPAHSKDKSSVNLQPQMKIINHPEYNDRQVFEYLNTKAKWLWKDFCHAFGVQMVESNGEFEFPGNFDGPEDSPEKWEYQGPLLGQTAQLMLVQQDNTKGGIRNAIKFYVCQFGASCSEKHSQNLAK